MTYAMKPDTGRSLGTWFRLYTSLIHDSKIRRDLSDTDALRFVYIMAAMKEGEVEGRPLESLAWFLHIDRDDLTGTIERLQAAGLLDEERIPVGWNERQFKTDGKTSTARVQAHRERKQAACNNDETSHETAGGCSLKRNETPQNRTEKSRREQKNSDSSFNDKSRIGSGSRREDPGSIAGPPQAADPPEAEPVAIAGGGCHE